MSPAVQPYCAHLGKGATLTIDADRPAGQRSSGSIASGFEAVRSQFDSFLITEPRYSAQLSAYWRGELVVDLVGGHSLAGDEISGVFSSSKGVAGLVIALLVQRGLLDLDSTVARYWPEFAAAGKGLITVRQLLSHQAGLSGISGGLELHEILESERGASRLAQMRPLWVPGSAFGYHAITIGVLMEELVRRVTGSSLQSLYEHEIRRPREIDFYLGLPESQELRYRDLLPMEPTPPQAAEIASRGWNPASLLGDAFSIHENIAGENVPVDPLWPNDSRVRAVGPAAIGGVGSAKGLAQVYAAAIEDFRGPRLLSETTVELVAQQQSWGTDRVLNFPACFGVVFMKPHPINDFGSHRAIGHDGAGGSLAFADPSFELAFGYIPNPMTYPGGSDPKALQLSATLRSCIETQRGSSR